MGAKLPLPGGRFFKLDVAFYSQIWVFSLRLQPDPYKLIAGFLPTDRYICCRNNLDVSLFMLPLSLASSKVDDWLEILFDEV